LPLVCRPHLVIAFARRGFAPLLDQHRGLRSFPTRRSSDLTVRFTLSAQRAFVVSIPAGTRVSMDGSVYFATDVYTEIPAGSRTADRKSTRLNATHVSSSYAVFGLKKKSRRP